MVEKFINVMNEIAKSQEDITDAIPEFLKALEISYKKDGDKVDIMKSVEWKDKEGLTDYQKNLLRDEYGWTDDKIDIMHSWEEAEDYIAEYGEITIAEKQEIADKVAQDYNNQFKPYDRAVEKGYEGIQKTDNGGVSFEDSSYIYTNENGDKAEVSIKATGNRSADFDAANVAFGLDKTPEGYVWHHVDDYNVKDGTITLQLVKDEAHNATKPHSGGCAQYDAVNGPSYNPTRKGV